jgi:hypothetical protein
MNLYYLLSCLLGVFIKIYDDFNDLKIKKYSMVLEISKIIIITCSFLLIQKNYILSIIIFISLLVSNYCKNFDNHFWYAYTYFIGFLCIAFYQKFMTIFSYFSYKLILFVLFIPICIYFEEITYVEEISKNKMLSRSYSIVINSVIILLLEYYDFIEKNNLYFFTYLILFINSYFMTNIIIQLLFVYSKTSKIVIKKKLKHKRIKTTTKNRKKKNKNI